MCGRVRLMSDYSEIKIRLKFAPDTPVPNFQLIGISLLQRQCSLRSPLVEG